VVDDWTSVRHLKDDRQIYVVQSLGLEDTDGLSCDTQEDLFATSDIKSAVLEKNSVFLDLTKLKFFLIDTKLTEESGGCGIISNPPEQSNVIGCAMNPEQGLLLIF